jgi:hypothetical protein
MPWRCITCLIKHHAVKTFIAQYIHNFGIKWDLPASSPGRFTPTYRMAIKVGEGLRAGLDAVAKKRLLLRPCRKSNPGRTTRFLVIILTEIPHIHVLNGSVSWTTGTEGSFFWYKVGDCLWEIRELLQIKLSWTFKFERNRHHLQRDNWNFQSHFTGAHRI